MAEAEELVGQPAERRPEVAGPEELLGQRVEHRSEAAGAGEAEEVLREPAEHRSEVPGVEELLEQRAEHESEVAAGAKEVFANSVEHGEDCAKLPEDTTGAGRSPSKEVPAMEGEPALKEQSEEQQEECEKRAVAEAVQASLASAGACQGDHPHLSAPEAIEDPFNEQPEADPISEQHEPDRIEDPINEQDDAENLEDPVDELPCEPEPPQAAPAAENAAKSEPAEGRMKQAKAEPAEEGKKHAEAKAEPAEEGKKQAEASRLVLMLVADAAASHEPQVFRMRCDQPLQRLLATYAKFRGWASDEGLRLSGLNRGFLDATATAGSYSLCDGDRLTVHAQEPAEPEQRQGCKAQAKAANLPAVGRPKRPKSAYVLWCSESRDAIAAELGATRKQEVTRVARERWKGLATEERAPFEARATEMKAEYEKVMAELRAQSGEQPAHRRKRGASAACEPALPEEGGVEKEKPAPEPVQPNPKRPVLEPILPDLTRELEPPALPDLKTPRKRPREEPPQASEEVALRRTVTPDRVDRPVLATQVFRPQAQRANGAAWTCSCAAHLTRHPRCATSGSVSKVHVTNRSTTFGRAETCDVVLTSERTPQMLSRCHATLKREGGRFTLTDQGSVNGCLVNDRIVKSTVPLRSGDVITFGTQQTEPEFDFIFELRCESIL